MPIAYGQVNGKKHPINQEQVIPGPVKKCKRCGEYKPYTAFKRDKTVIGGRRNVCRDCNKVKPRQKKQIEMRKCLVCGIEKPVTEFYNESTCGMCKLLGRFDG